MKRALIVLLLLAIPVAGQTHGVFSTTMSLRFDVPITEFQDVQIEGQLGAPTCTVDHLGGDASGTALRFQEGTEEQGCSEARYQLPVPAGATSATLSFHAFKEVIQSVGDLPVAVETNVVVFGTNGVRDTRSFFSELVPREATQVPFVFELPVNPGQRTLTFGWYFADGGRGGDTGVVPLGSSVHVDIIEPTIRFDGIPVGAEIEVRQVEVTRSQVEQHVLVPAVIPEGLGGVEILYRVQSDLSTSHVLLPDGRRLADTAYTDGSVEGVHQLRVPEAVVARYGAGTYTAVFAATTALEPTPLLVPFILAILIAPMPLGVFATRSAQRFQEIAVGRYVAAARNLRLALAFWWTVYLVAILLVFTGRMWPVIVSWPIQVQAAVVHGGFVVISLVFVSLGFYWRRQLADTMESELADKERANRELARSNEELQQFAYVASHDLQEPLRTVARFTQLLERRYGAKLDDDAREFMAYTVDGAKRMQGLIDGLLELSRVETRGRPMAPVDLNRVCERATRALAASIAASGAHVTCKPLPVVFGDELQLGQVFQNLLGNALKFRGERTPEIEVRAEQRQHEWVIAIQDNGIGIERRHFDRIFVVFQRLHARDEYEGTGMGLALCKKIIERHGGRIWLESTPGKGTTFCFTLLHPDQAQARRV